jgi:hypothetical protein
MSQDTCEGHVRGAGINAHYDTDSDSADLQLPQSTNMGSTQQDIEQVMQDSGGGKDVFEAWRDASVQPPITPDSLAELDMPRIINNPKLRHDVNFDRELHFRPNLDGSKGKEKIRCADRYWKGLEGELVMLGAVQQALQTAAEAARSAYWQALMAKSRKRLPRIFEVIRDILKTLVPDQDQQKILDRLNVDLIIQQIDHGMCDLVDLSTWLAKVLKNHCAPMRDTMVDKMQASISNGAQQGDQPLLVVGLRQLLQILEAMKLDVANHQIRHMRPLLIGDTINFQQRYNAHRIALGKISAESSRAWLEQEYETFGILGPVQATEPTYLDALTHALLRDLLFASSTTYLTPTFYLDLDRLRALRLDMHSMISHHICSDILVQLVDQSIPKTELAGALTVLRTSLTAIVGTQGRWMEQVENIATEIVRIVLMLENRTPPFDADMYGLAERKLLEDLSTSSPAFSYQAQDMLDRLYPKAQEKILAHIKFSALDLQDALVPPLQPAITHTVGFGAVLEPAGPAKPTDPDFDIVRRFSHMIVLHWQIWADLVYLAPPEFQSDSDRDIDRYRDSRSPSPDAMSPEPVSHALFPIGHKFLPNAVTTVNGSARPTPTASPDPEHDYDDPADTERGSLYPDNEF